MTNNLTPLFDAWLDAKNTEQSANRRRIVIEKEICAALSTKTEGSLTHEIDGYKVTLTQPINRKVDMDIWDRVSVHVSHAMAPVRVKYEVDAAQLKYLKNNEPDIFAKIAPAFSSTPGKVGVKVTKESE